MHHYIKEGKLCVCEGTFGFLVEDGFVVKDAVAIGIRFLGLEIEYAINLKGLDGPNVDLYALKLDEEKRPYLEWYKDGGTKHLKLQSKKEFLQSIYDKESFSKSIESRKLFLRSIIRSKNLESRHNPFLDDYEPFEEDEGDEPFEEEEGELQD